MPAFYLDTSALFKRYQLEPGTDFISELLGNRGTDDSFITSHFTAIEIEAASARALRARLLNQRSYSTLLGQFSNDIASLIILQPITSYIVSMASETARRNALRAGDAVHLATALFVRQTLSELVFVTSDFELFAASGSEGFLTIDPARKEAMGLLKSLRG